MVLDLLRTLLKKISEQQQGRKSAKGKEKKQRRKEETAKLNVALIKVDAANKIEDPMSLLLPFKKYERNGLSLTIDCLRVKQMDSELVDWIFQITKDNMQKLYEASEWGWKDREKRDELTEDAAQYLIARDADRRPVAYVHFRFDMDFDDEVVYCYEIQLTEDVRRKGLGKFLMQILELLAHKTDMIKVMLTTFKHNPDATGFFINTMKYQVDETSPCDPIFEEEYSYQILSKLFAPKKSTVSAASTPVTNTQSQPVLAS